MERLHGLDVPEAGMVPAESFTSVGFFIQGCQTFTSKMLPASPLKMPPLLWSEANGGCESGKDP
jgi:hypothetical protein